MSSINNFSWNQLSLKEPLDVKPTIKTDLDPNKDITKLPFSNLNRKIRLLTRKELWTETYLAHRLYYKNFNQHRTTYTFKLYQKLIQHLKKLSQLDINRIAKKLQTQFYDLKGSKLGSDVGWSHLPNQNMLKYFLLKFTGCYHLVNQLLKCCEEVFNGYDLMVKSADFMHKSLTIISIASRLHLLLKSWNKALIFIIEFLTNLTDLYKVPLILESALGIPKLNSLDDENSDELMTSTTNN